MAARRSFLLRIDPELHVELERWAQQEMRSVNGQIEFLLRQAVVRRRGSEPHAAAAPHASGQPTDETA